MKRASSYFVYNSAEVPYEEKEISHEENLLPMNEYSERWEITWTEKNALPSKIAIDCILCVYVGYWKNLIRVVLD